MMQLSPSTDPASIAQHQTSAREAVLQWLAQLFASERATVFVLTVALAVALLAAIGPLVSNRFHRDEAIYSSWGLAIASGRDLLVSGSPVDKPPLFLYTQALSFLTFGPTESAARLPSLVASMISVGLIFVLGRSLYGRGVGLLAAILLAASPFAILFAPTAFTDPMMVMWMLAGCLVVVRGRWVWGGIFLGLAAITKQQGIFFVPLALGLGLLLNPKSANLRSRIVSFVVTFLVVLGVALAWDIARAHQPGFLSQSLINYGGLSFSPAVVWERLLGFGSLLRYGTGSPVLNGILLVGVPLLLVVDALLLLDLSPALSRKLGIPGVRLQARYELILVAFVVLFLVGHSAVAFGVWDRYLLGLIPWLALLLARVLTLPYRLLRVSPLSNLISVLFIFWMLSFTLHPIRDAAASRYPIGGDHGAYDGIRQVVDYFQAVPSDTTLYHRWLGWHWRFYLWGNSYDLPAWTSPTDLAKQAASRPGAQRYVVFPSWRSSTEARFALAQAGLTMREVHHTFRDDGSISFIVYQIEEAP